jgi:hypothetical protein
MKLLKLPEKTKATLGLLEYVTAVSLDVLSSPI